MSHSTTVVSIMNAGAGYMVIATTTDSLRVVNDTLMTKPQAQALAAQERQRLALDAMAQNAPDSRAGRAAQLLASGAVKRNGNRFTVFSQSTNVVYHTDATSCDCPDATYNGKTCKHQLAVRMHQRQAAHSEFDDILAEVRNGQYNYVTLTDAQLAAADAEPMYTDWRG